MFRKSVSIVTVCALATLGLVALGAQPAAAASQTGELRVRGPGGTAYTKSAFNSQVGSVGATLTYTFEVVNTDTTVAQYHLFVQDDVNVPSSLYDGSLFLTPLASSPDGYYTKALAPGGAQPLTLKVKVPASVGGQHAYTTNIYLYSTDGNFITNLVLFHNEAAPMPQTTPYDMYTKNGSQKAIGWSLNHTQILTAGTISATGTATFTVTLQNDGVGPARIYFGIADSGSCGNMTVTVKDNTTNVTTAAFNGVYVTPLLAHAAKKNLTVSVKSSSNLCPDGVWSIASNNTPIDFSTAETDILVVNIAA